MKRFVAIVITALSLSMFATSANASIFSYNAVKDFFVNTYNQLTERKDNLSVRVTELEQQTKDLAGQTYQAYRDRDFPNARELRRETINSHTQWRITEFQLYKTNQRIKFLKRAARHVACKHIPPHAQGGGWCSASGG